MNKGSMFRNVGASGRQAALAENLSLSPVKPLACSLVHSAAALDPGARKSSYTGEASYAVEAGRESLCSPGKGQPALWSQ